jgi:hypothetical protein
VTISSSTTKWLLATDDQPFVPVTADNFPRAETDMHFSRFVKRGALGKFIHFRALPLDGAGVRPNRDILYSEAVFDLDAGPVTIRMPDPGSRFMSLMAIDEDHYVREVVYGAGEHTYTKGQIGTRYLFTSCRTFVDSARPEDITRAHALQDAVIVTQPGGPGCFESPHWDPISRKTVRDTLLALNTTLPDLRQAFGARGQVDPVRHLIGTASGWGGNPDTEAISLNVTPLVNDASGIYILTVRDVPVHAFWSITVYDGNGWFTKNDPGAYSVNSIAAVKNGDGSVTVQFGGCDGRSTNCLPITPGWNYMVRLYRPRPEILDGTWQFPDAQLLRLDTSHERVRTLSENTSSRALG